MNTRCYRSKIGRLPFAIRNELNERIRDGAQGAEILEWLNGLKETKRILREMGGPRSGAAVVALAALAALVNYVISIVAAFRRSPPLPEELAQRYATKKELADEIAELKDELKGERERVDKILSKQFDLIRGLTAETTERYNRLESSISSWQRGIERLIGKIEGKVESK